MISFRGLEKEWYAFFADWEDALYIHKKTFKMIVKKGAVKRYVSKIQKKLKEEEKRTGRIRLI